MNEELNRALDQISDEHIREVACYRKSPKAWWIGSIAAALAMIICWTAVWGELTPPVTVTNPTTHPTDPSDPGVQNAQPSSYFYFQSTDEIRALFAASKLSDEKFQDYVSSMKFRPYTELSSTRQSVNKLKLLLQTMPVPYVDGEFSSLYYYYENSIVELFMTVDGIQYQFLLNGIYKPFDGEPAVTGVSIGDVTFDLFLKNDQLHGVYLHKGWRGWVTAYTNDPSKVDFSAFQLKTLLEAQGGQSNPVVGPVVVPLSYQVATPVYPQMVQCPKYSDYGNDNYNAYIDALGAWRKARRQQYDQPTGYADSLKNFWAKSIPEFLSGEDNRAYSPVNVYLALAMLAETTGGNSRQEILDLLGADSIEALRTQASHVWNAHYCDDGKTTSLLANSLWLDEVYTFNKETIQTLADSYYASVFHGDLGTDEMNEQLRQWLNAQTGGLLKEQSKNTELSQDSVFALCSTVYFAADWSGGFDKNTTFNQVFHSRDEDLTTPFMNKTITKGIYYWGEDFGAVYLPLSSGGMWLILPDEGKTVEDVLSSDEYLEMTLDPSNWQNKKKLKVNLSIPKFDISSQADLVQGMKNLGLGDVFNSNVSDFTPMTDTRQLFLGKIDHAVRVAVDEEGLIAAAYTVMDFPCEDVPTVPDNEIDFIADRPFLFVVSSHDNLPLFTGVVEKP